MEFKNRPTFGVTTPVQEQRPTQSSEDKSYRPEMGAVWKRQSRNNMEYMSIKLSLTKDMLRDLLSKEGDLIQVNLVAFPNKSQNGNMSRPSFRIYEETAKENS